MKKKLFVALVLVAVLCLGLCLSAQAAHTHTFKTGTVTKAPTCASTGIRVDRCSCGATKNVTLAKTGEHYYHFYSMVGGSCQVGKKTTYKCLVCGAYMTRYSPVDPDAHISIEKKVVAATCTTAGKETTTCVHCGKVVETKVLPKLGHDRAGGAYTTAPTCTRNGSYVVYCSRCGAVSQNETISPLGHSMKQIAIVPGNCTYAGTVTLKCIRCSFKTTAATCIYPGSHASFERRNGKIYCSDCGVEVK